MSSAAANGCWHCGEALPRDPPCATVNGATHEVCCHGCRAAAEWIEQLGLGDYYRLRSEPAERALDAAASERDMAVWMRPELSRHVVRMYTREGLGENGREAVLLIEGIRCSACVWLLERALVSAPGVVRVQVNISSRRARVLWDATLCNLPQVLSAIVRTGYRALPIDAKALDDLRKRESRDALKRLVVAGLGTMQAMMYASALYLGAFDGIDETTRDLMRWLGLLVATPVVFYSARPFFAGALRSLRARVAGMDIPVALAIALIYAASVLVALRGGSEVYFDSVSMFVFFLLIGRYLEMRARHRASDMSDALARLMPVFADRKRGDGSLERIGAIELEAGDQVHIAEGSTVPADGVLASATCRVNEALLSGESATVVKRKGDALIAGSVMVDGPATMRVEHVGHETALAGIVALVTRAGTERPKLARVGERVASAFVVRVLILSVITALGWVWFDPSRAFTATLAVLVVSCPCAFALAVPAALTRALAVLADRGVLIVQPDAIENLAKASHIVFDKTGTLTDPQLALSRIETLRDIDRADAHRLASALASGSRHPAAMAIASAHDAVALPDVEQLVASAGDGLAGTIAGHSLRLGRADFALANTGSDYPYDDAVLLADRRGPIAAFHLSERLRPGTQNAITALQADGLHLEIASGDARDKVALVARELGIDHWHARMRPADKLDRLRDLRAQGAKVIVVGDGINDAPVLAGADVSVAFASGAELAQAASDVVLTGNTLDGLVGARKIAAQTLTILRQNQRWALAWNLLAVPFAAFGMVPPWLAALGMSISSLVVVMNALRIGRKPPASQRALDAPLIAPT